MRIIAIIGATFALVFAGSAQARHWPVPPGWWLHSDFAKCVRLRESTNGLGSHNLYGMLDGWTVAHGAGDAWHASFAEQDYRAWLLWNKLGDGPWRPYDGCSDYALAGRR